MKKTLVALAVLAVSGASYAQVTITGAVAMGYKSSFNPSAESASNPTAAAVGDALLGGRAGNPIGDSSGLGVDTTLVVFTAKEDLGDGMSVTASMSIDGLNRGGVSGGDSSLKLVTSVGALELQTYKPADYLSGGISGVGGVGMDNKVFTARTTRDTLGFTTKLGPVYVGVSQSEQGKSDNAGTAATQGTALGLGVGAAGIASSIGQRINSISGTYVGGPLIANVNYLSYDGRDTSTAITPKSITGADKTLKDVMRMAASYDLGMAKFGLGYSRATQTSGSTLSDALVAVSVPLGALTMGANFASSTLSDVLANSTSGFAQPAGAFDGTRTGYGLSAAYALSKRTTLSASYANWNSTPFASSRSTEASVLIGHSF